MDYKNNSALYNEKIIEELQKAYYSMNHIYHLLFIANLDSGDEFLYDVDEAKKHISYHNRMKKELFNE